MSENDRNEIKTREANLIELKKKLHEAKLKQMRQKKLRDERKQKENWKHWMNPLVKRYSTTSSFVHYGSNMKRSRDVGDAGRCSKQSGKRKRCVGINCSKQKNGARRRLKNKESNEGRYLMWKGIDFWTLTF